jgi:hypothetical protein
MVVDIEKALAFVAFAADREKIETLKRNAERLGATVVVEAANAKLANLAGEAKAAKAAVQVGKGYRKSHQLSDWTIEYAHIRGRDWLANLYRDGQFVAEGPVTWKNDRKDGKTIVWFTKRERAEDYATREEFLAVSRLTNVEAAGLPTVFDAVLTLKPASEVKSGERGAFYIEASVVKIEM